MKFAKNKTKVIAIALCLMFAMSTLLVLIPPANATNTKTTYSVCSVQPAIAGVGQQCLIWYGITDMMNWPSTGFNGLTVTVTRPDGTTETLGPLKTDLTGSGGASYVPTMVGNYTFQSHFPEQIAPYAAPNYPANTTMKASDSINFTLVVQQAPIQVYPPVPLPTEYWTRPINGQNREWSAIGGNWLHQDRSTGVPPTSQIFTDTTGPETAHIMWRRQDVMGGIVGGYIQNLTESGGGARDFGSGEAYEGKWTACIIGGILYSNAMWPIQSAYQAITATDLHTGKQLWVLNNTREAFGQLLYYHTFNLQDVFAYLWDTDPGRTGVAGSTWKAYDAYTGAWWYTMTNVPSGTMVYGPNGELLIYTVDLAHGWMTLWNSTNIPTLYNSDDWSNQYNWASWRPYGKTVNATGPCTGPIKVTPYTPLGLNGYMWNKTIPKGLPGAVIKIRGDYMLGSNLITYDVTADPIVFWALNLKAGQEGTLLFNTSWALPASNITMSVRDASAEDGVFVVTSRDTRQWWCFSLNTGLLLWGPTAPQEQLDWVGFAQIAWVDIIAYGKLYSGSYSGIMHCYDIKTGALLWTYTCQDKYTDSLFGSNWQLGIKCIADGKIYIGVFEHSSNNPWPRDSPYFCLNATTGALIWSVPLRSTYRDSDGGIADGILVAFDTYDNNIYAIGMGPTAITATAPDIVQPLGTPILIKGTVTDTSPGTTETQLALRFPDGVPAVSDASMSDWMGYLYWQQPRPTNATGVPVSIDVVDANGNYRNIGNTTSDSNGAFSLQWTPDITGTYQVVATFAGSKSYWPSHSETSFAVNSAAPTASPYPVVNLPPTETYFAISTVAIIIAIAIVGVLLAMLMRRKRP
jgi:outer membrane protein assembly factor BamB